MLGEWITHERHFGTSSLCSEWNVSTGIVLPQIVAKETPLQLAIDNISVRHQSGAINADTFSLN